jgi:type II restriction enzyme
MKKQGTLPTVTELNAALIPLQGQKVSKPAGSTLAGHAAGLPFEDLIHSKLVETYDGRTLRHYEALNRVLLDNPGASTYEERLALMGDPPIQYLLARGKATMTNWSPTDQFKVKQDDTAESIIFPNKTCDLRSDRLLLIDVKTQDVDKKAQAPNIMSAGKLATACVLALECNAVPFEIIYTGVKWRQVEDALECIEVKAISLLKIKPDSLYINWVAAQQLQFHPFEVDQSYTKSPKEWCLAYIETFCNQLEKRVAKEETRLANFREALRTHS